MKIYNLQFDGSWSDNMRDQLPEYSGVYLVYRGVLNRDGFICREILYIGQAENIRARLINHDKHDQFLAECRLDEGVFYSCAQVAKADLNRVENALIYEMKPRLNETMKESFPYEKTVVSSSGQCSLLNTNFAI